MLLFREVRAIFLPKNWKVWNLYKSDTMLMTSANLPRLVNSNATSGRGGGGGVVKELIDALFERT
jgi:hypothetical protein